MNLIENIASLRIAQQAWKASEQKIALVPTMGNLHAGHLKLVEVAKQTGYTVVVSIFVNPLQFSPTEDWDRYPRTLSEDVCHLQTLGVDAVFAPQVSELYPNGQTSTLIQPGALAQDLCGVSRPSHFAGVATVVAKLFNLIQPQLVVFGEKDRQQVVIIQRMIEDLNFPVEMLTVPTVRDEDGLALSSRNRYLSATERKVAPELYKALSEVKQQLAANIPFGFQGTGKALVGEDEGVYTEYMTESESREQHSQNLEGEGYRDYHTLCNRAIERLKSQGFIVDYLTIRQKEDLAQPGSVQNAENLVVLAAALLGSTRLIDNV